MKLILIISKYWCCWCCCWKCAVYHTRWINTIFSCYVAPIILLKGKLLNGISTALLFQSSSLNTWCRSPNRIVQYIPSRIYQCDWAVMVLINHQMKIILTARSVRVTLSHRDVEFFFFFQHLTSFYFHTGWKLLVEIQLVNCSRSCNKKHGWKIERNYNRNAAGKVPLYFAHGLSVEFPGFTSSLRSSHWRILRYQQDVHLVPSSCKVETIASVGDEDGRVVHVNLVRHLHLPLHLFSSVHSRWRNSQVAEEYPATAEDHRGSAGFCATAGFQLSQLWSDDRLAETVQCCLFQSNGTLLHREVRSRYHHYFTTQSSRR